MIFSFVMIARFSVVIGIIVLKIVGFHQVTSQEDKEGIPYKFAAEPTLPSLVVFNFDETIWPFKLDDVMTPPLVNNGPVRRRQIKDKDGNIFELLPKSAAILEDLFNHWYKIGGLVESNNTEKVENVMKLFDLDRLCKLFHIFPKASGSITEHVERMRERAEVPMDEILYFGSNQNDIEQLKSLKVIAVHVPPTEGISYTLLEQGLKMYHDAMKHTLAYHYETRKKNEYDRSELENML